MPRQPFQRYKELHLGQLRTFCECIRQRSYSAAARTLQMSQPAVWQQVQALERDLGVSLVQRRGQQLEPSEDGLVLLELANSIVGSMDTLRERFDQRRQDVPRTLTVIGSPGVILEELALPVASFCRQYPRIKLSLLNYVHLSTLDMVIDGKADMAILPRALDLGGNQRFLTSEPLAQRTWSLLLPADHPLLRKRRVTPADLVRSPLILPETGSRWRQRVDEVFRAAGLLDRVQVRMEVAIPLAARRYVSLGVGLAVYPKSPGGLAFPNLEVRSLEDMLGFEEIALFRRRGAALTPQAQLFAEYTRSQLQEAQDAEQVHRPSKRL
ncbi:MAG TPA: LysR family transcriptional regulator [Gemmataceae bacterium]|jgi:DNA-binding transcriptional LysR family regulator